jgi:hypothetical protein
MDLFRPFKKKIEYIEKPVLLSNKNQEVIHQSMELVKAYVTTKNEIVKKQQSKIDGLDQYSDSVCTKTILDWRNALESARDIKKPNRYDLIDLYAELKLDAFLDSAVNIQKAMLKSIERQAKVNGENDDTYTKLFNSYWYDLIMDGYVEADLQGFSVFEIQNIVKDGEIWNIGDMVQVPSKHIVPEYSAIKTKPWDYTMGDYSYVNNDYIIEIIVENNRNLGKLSKLAPLLIYKKLAWGQWSQFLESYGIPSMVVKSAIKNTDKEVEFMEQLEELGGAIKMLLDTNDDVSFLQPSSTDAYQTFVQLINTCDETVANEIIGGSSLLKTGNNGSYALSNNHMGITVLKRKNDLKLIERFTNNTLIPQLKRLGIIPMDLDIKFEFGDVEQLTRAEQIEIDSRLLQYMDLNIDYLERKYNTKIDKYRDGSTSGLQPDPKA